MNQAVYTFSPTDLSLSSKPSQIDIPKDERLAIMWVMEYDSSRTDTLEKNQAEADSVREKIDWFSPELQWFLYDFLKIYTGDWNKIPEKSWNIFLEIQIFLAQLRSLRDPQRILLHISAICKREQDVIYYKFIGFLMNFWLICPEKTGELFCGRALSQDGSIELRWSQPDIQDAYIQLLFIYLWNYSNPKWVQARLPFHDEDEKPGQQGQYMDISAPIDNPLRYGTQSFSLYRYFVNSDIDTALRLFEDYFVYWLANMEYRNTPSKVIRRFTEKHAEAFQNLENFSNKRKVSFMNLPLVKKILQEYKAQQVDVRKPKKKLQVARDSKQPTPYTSPVIIDIWVYNSSVERIEQPKIYAKPSLNDDTITKLMQWEPKSWNSGYYLLKSLERNISGTLWYRLNSGDWKQVPKESKFDITSSSIDDSHHFCFVAHDKANPDEVEEDNIVTIRVTNKTVARVIPTVESEVVSVLDTPISLPEINEDPNDDIALAMLASLENWTYTIQNALKGVYTLSFSWENSSYIARFYVWPGRVTLSWWKTEKDNTAILDNTRDDLKEAFLVFLEELSEKTEQIFMTSLRAINDRLIAASSENTLITTKDIVAFRQNWYYTGLTSMRNGHRAHLDTFLSEMRWIWLDITPSQVDIWGKQDAKWKEMRVVFNVIENPRIRGAIHSQTGSPGYDIEKSTTDTIYFDKIQTLAISLLLLFGKLGMLSLEEASPKVQPKNKKSRSPSATDILSGEYKKDRISYASLDKKDQDSIWDLVLRLHSGRAKLSRWASIDNNTGFMNYAISPGHWWDDVREWDMLVLRDESIRADTRTKPNHEVYGLIDASLYFQKYMLKRLITTIADIEGISLTQDRREKSPFQNGAWDFFRAFWFSLTEEKRTEFKSRVGLSPAKTFNLDEWLQVDYNWGKTIFQYFMELVRRESGTIQYWDGNIYIQNTPLSLIYSRPVLISSEDLDEYRDEISSLIS